MKNEFKGGRRIDDWRPEDEQFWENGGKQVASRNLWISIPALLLAFSVWVIWSVIVVRMPEVGFQFDKAQLSWLVALPALSGATMRIFYSFMVPIFGGRRWTAISTASLLIPTIWLGFAIQNPDTTFTTFAIIALLCGLGGANFSSSMSNISFFYPKSKQGTALGLNAGLGNLGVSVSQFVIPAVIGFSLFGALAGEGQMTESGKVLYLQNAAFVWVIPIAIMTVLAWFGMNDLSGAKASFKEQSVIFGRQHTWIMCILYLATFGSFIGFSAAFPMVIKQSFPDVDPLKVAFLGPLVGALFRPVGGWLADKIGGARVTFWVYVVMAISVVAVMFFLKMGNFIGYFVGFMLLFMTSGIGNASTFRMIPVIFRTMHERYNSPDLVNQARKESAAVVGFAGGFAAYGGFFIPKMFGSGLGINGTFIALIVFYVVCIALTWWYYSRKGAEFPS
ncbi:MAG TPA: NarK family nitrate/nitrite MFS transporter [Moraxella sp.]|jgi:MFS transporter, NNP family, nitrate/nitrite transporter|nr:MULTISPECIES: NarK family nitrate/nitrite MFS transporter [Pseudomonadota]ATQ86253.1 nitrate/nitrite transporter [Moraxella osloensis]MBL7668809.1 NarK family nitrate/nitrite MFS transporter [Moraxella osloensis]VXA90681.1 nitrate/nitrite transporter [Enhydrobacter sp. AX1]HCC66881.1 NarK family nitrate/nitrite MFS transporter [Moraxella sp.]